MDNSVRQFIGIIALSLLCSCSWLSSRESLFGDDPKPDQSQTVPRAQYDALQKKYQDLVNKTQNMPAPQQTQATGSSMDVEKLKQDLQDSTQLDATVDAFPSQNMPVPVGIDKRRPAPKPINYDSPLVEKHVSILKRAYQLMGENKFDQTLNEVKKIENSQVKQVRVRAKFILGEILFRQQEYDLAMQIFEEILTREAFSGLVLKSLGRLIVCSEKLKLSKKKEKYYSMLHDFFEQA